MYIYDFGYHSHEDSQYWQVSHKEQFTPEQFLEHVENCLFEVLKKIIEPRSTTEHHRDPNLSDLFGNDAFPKEMQKLGYEPLKFQAQLSLFGWSSSYCPQDWKGHFGADQSRIVKRLRRRLVKWKPNIMKELAIGKAKENAETRKMVRKFKAEEKIRKAKEEAEAKEAKKE